MKILATVSRLPKQAPSRDKTAVDSQWAPSVETNATKNDLYTATALHICSPSYASFDAHIFTATGEFHDDIQAFEVST